MNFHKKDLYGNAGGGPEDHREHVQHSAVELRPLPPATTSLFPDDAEELYPSPKRSLACEEASYSHPSRTRSLGTWDQRNLRKGPGDPSLPPPPLGGICMVTFIWPKKPRLYISLCTSVSFSFFVEFQLGITLELGRSPNSKNGTAIQPPWDPG